MPARTASAGRCRRRPPPPPPPPPPTLPPHRLALTPALAFVGSFLVKSACFCCLPLAHAHRCPPPRVLIPIPRSVATWEDPEYVSDLQRRGITAVGLPWDTSEDLDAIAGRAEGEGGSGGRGPAPDRNEAVEMGGLSAAGECCAGVQWPLTCSAAPTPLAAITPCVRRCSPTRAGRHLPGAGPGLLRPRVCCFQPMRRGSCGRHVG